MVFLCTRRGFLVRRATKPLFSPKVAAWRSSRGNVNDPQMDGAVSPITSVSNQSAFSAMSHPCYGSVVQLRHRGLGQRVLVSFPLFCLPYHHLLSILWFSLSMTSRINAERNPNSRYQSFELGCVGAEHPLVQIACTS